MIMRIRMEEINGRLSPGSCNDDNLSLSIKFRFLGRESDGFVFVLMFITARNEVEAR